MKKQICVTFLLVITISCNSAIQQNNNSTSATNSSLQTKSSPTQQTQEVYTEKFTKPYKEMNSDEKTTFIAEKSREIAKRISGNDYAFTSDFENRIKLFVDGYSKRIGTGRTKIWDEDLNFLLKRGGEFAPAINSSFDKNRMSRLMGLYVCMVEMEFHNIESENFAGAKGLFQLMAPFAKEYGLEPKDRNDPGKAANAAARYLKDRIKQFEQDKMKEALAILSYNRSPSKTEKDLKLVLNDSNKNCSICALSENSEKLDFYFQSENIKYVPKVFAAAIVGENPQAFGLETKPLSTF